MSREGKSPTKQQRSMTVFSGAGSNKQQLSPERSGEFLLPSSSSPLPMGEKPRERKKKEKKEKKKEGKGGEG